MPARLPLGSAWPVHPKPLPGEVLSSWLSRTAAGNGLTLYQFRKVSLPKTPGRGADIDLIDTPTFFEEAAHRALLPVETVFGLGYAADEGVVYASRTKGNLEWISPLTRAGYQARHPSIPFCPSCLAEDSEPYYRKQWRYGFAPVCERHGLLTNECPGCGQPYCYQGNDGGELSSGTIDRCRRCQRKYRSRQLPGLSDAALEAALAAQGGILSILDTGLADICGEQVHVCMYLKGLHDLATLLLSEAHGEKASKWIAGESGLPQVRPEWGGSVEGQSAVVRAAMVAQVGWLVGEWPDRFVALIEAVDLPAAALPAKHNRPSWLSNPAIDRYLLRSVRVGRAEEEVESARAVLAKRRQWAPNNAEVEQFLKTGVAPPVRLKVKPPTDELRSLIDAADERRDATWARRKATRTAKEASKSLFPATKDLRELGDELLSAVDDTTERLPALSAWKRKSRAKPAS